MYLRYASLSIAVMATFMASGCCTMGPYAGHPGNYPMGYASDCGECVDGCETACYPPGPLHAVHAWGRGVLHGHGCGSIYRGEWLSTPPSHGDPCWDPCSGLQAYGYGHHWHPGKFLGHLYGKRFCGGCGLGHVDYGCAQPGGCYDGDCGCQGEVISEGEYIEPSSSARMATGMAPQRATMSPSTSRSQGNSAPSRSRITRDAGSRRVPNQRN
ncbi:MAG: hypothetical protein MK108_03190 [Mariniblastus sp.]|nr:hypothetical protein [Mariniblastus sp.]